ncbi:MAG TPA: 3-hydroxyacyl-ACP dehydratase FabZ [Caulobacteraceae bacterium]|jgi:3-hydroxyacyl-[acyl-carrier-protein] dehydratase
MSDGETSAAAGSNIDLAEVMRLIPHRPPFLMIDRAENYKQNESIVGVKCVTMNEPYFAGHFPGYPVMPGVLIIECLAQTGGVLMSKSLELVTAGKVVMFMSVDNCRFRAPVRPGDVLRMHVEVTRARGDVFRFRGRATVDDRMAAECEFAAMLVSATLTP